MEIVRFKQDSYRQKTRLGTLYSGVEYILHDRAILECEDATIMSGFDILERRPFVWKNWQYPEPCERLLVYVTGKIGDMLWLTAVFSKLKKLLPRLHLTVVTSWPEVFENNKDVDAIRLAPLPLEAVWSFDGAIFLDAPVANDRTLEQRNCYEILFRAFGLAWEPGTIVTPKLRLTQDDEDSAFARIVKPDSAGEMWSTRMHLVLGLHSSVRSRNFPPIFWKKIVARFAERFQHHENFWIYGFSDDERIGGDIQESILELKLPNYTPVHNRLSLRQIAAVIRSACCVISVDTMFVHLAAAMNTACVPLMTTVPPNVRVGTYPLVRPLWKGSACQYAPCFWKEDQFRFQMADCIEILPCYVPDRSYCDVAMAVTVQDVEQAFIHAINSKEAFDHFYIPQLPKL